MAASGILENRATRDKACPRYGCRSPAGTPCVNRFATPLMHPHKERVDLVRADIADQGAPGWPPRM